MTRDQVIERLTDVLIDTFDDDDLVYREDLTARDVGGWDSLSNIRFMVAVEQAFGTRLTIAQWQSMARVGDLVDLLTPTA
ncbi:acyl carrier protein [Sphingomonas sp. Leaf4]|uniref:acyl carrier protein n=1 Tax=Sphingomonas sp. Leaf4 TaxID=2876553 RepID=UPI001E29FED2|nr:acyl carrier protein [Sphingomonas sp. Leaf4]